LTAEAQRRREREATRALKGRTRKLNAGAVQPPLTHRPPPIIYRLSASHLDMPSFLFRTFCFEASESRAHFHHRSCISSLILRQEGAIPRRRPVLATPRTHGHRVGCTAHAPLGGVSFSTHQPDNVPTPPGTLLRQPAWLVTRHSSVRTSARPVHATPTQQKSKKRSTCDLKLVYLSGGGCKQELTFLATCYRGVQQSRRYLFTRTFWMLL